MAGQRSAFNFSSRTFAHRTLAQSLSRSLSAFSSFKRGYLDPVIEADQSARNVDILALPQSRVNNLSPAHLAVSQCFQNIELKLPMAKCHCVQK